MDVKKFRILPHVDFELHEDRKEILHEKAVNCAIAGAYRCIAELALAYIVIFLAKVHLEAKNISAAILLTVIIVAGNILLTRNKIKEAIESERQIAEWQNVIDDAINALKK